MAGERQAASSEPAATAATPAADVTGTAGDAPDAATAAAVSHAEYALRFELIFAETYHADRAAFLRRANKAGSFLSAMFGTTAVGGALGDKPGLAATAGFLIAMIGTGEIVLDLAGQAHKHEAQIERLRALAADLAVSDKSDASLRAIDGRRLHLEPVEAAAFHAALALAWNTAYLRLSSAPDPKVLLLVPAIDAVFRHIRRYTPGRFISAEPLNL